MPTKGGARNKRIWEERRETWFAEHPACFQCGSSEQLRIHWNGDGPKPRRSMLEAFRLKEPRRSEILADCVAICRKCWLPTQLRNEHGGGRTGISGCRCDLCLPLRQAVAREWNQRQTEKWQQRRQLALKRGVPIPQRTVSKQNNAWNRSEEGVAAKRTKRQRARDEWLAGKVCAICGGDYKLRTTWIKRPGPLRTTSEIWAFGDERRTEYLELCHTLCVSCLRITTSGRRKGKQ